MARIAVGEFINQVRAETRKVTWPTRKETITTTIFVVVLTTVLSIFFFGVDAILSKIVEALLSLV